MPELDSVLIRRDQIARRVEEIGRALSAQLAHDIARHAAGQTALPAAHQAAPAGPDARVVLVPVLTGAMVFVADLIRHIPAKMSVRPIVVSSYPGAATTSQGVTIRGELPTDLAGAHVILVDDILDSGRTLGLLRRMIDAQGPASLRLAVLLRKRKPSGRDEAVAVDHAGFDIEDEFVVGYGLDYDGFYRNLPDIMTMRAVP